MTPRATACAAVLVLVTLAGESRADPPTAAEIVKSAEDALRGASSEIKLKMTITTPRWTRELVLRSWDDRRKNRSFVRAASFAVPGCVASRYSLCAA